MKYFASFPYIYQLQIQRKYHQQNFKKTENIPFQRHSIHIYKKKYHLLKINPIQKVYHRIPLFTFRKKCFPLFCLGFILTNDRLHLRCFDARVYIEVIKAYIHLSSSQKYQNQYINKRMPDTERFSMLLHKCCPDYNMYEILNSFLH